VLHVLTRYGRLPIAGSTSDHPQAGGQSPRRAERNRAAYSPGRPVSSYARRVLPLLRDDRGKPSVTVRVLAATVVLGMLLLAAPALVPVLRWAGDLFF
jgi:hypothetical protein